MRSNQPEHGILVPVDAIFPDLRADEATLVGLLQRLSRTDTLFWCARLNLLVSGPGTDDPRIRQQRALRQLCTGDEIHRVSRLAAQYGGASHVRVFFRGQLLELMRWAAKYCVDHPGDGTTFEDPAVRRRFVQAALIAGELWSIHVYGDRFTLEGGLGVARRRALPSIRKAIEEGGTAQEFESALGGGWTLFSRYFPRHYPVFPEEFRLATGLTPEEYYTKASQARETLPKMARDVRHDPPATKDGRRSSYGGGVGVTARQPPGHCWTYG
jgi:hypothetical protein